MKFSHFFIDRPIFASVISIIIMLVGGIAYFNLPVTQYPEIVPPSVVVSANYSGASPEVIMNTVAAPIEEQINGVEDMLYMQSQCSSDGSMQITVTFKTGTDVDKAQILTQNRVETAKPRLPPEVTNIGVMVKKRSPNIILFGMLISPDGTRDKLYLTNYAISQMKDRLARIKGVGEIQIFGAKEYAMRVWLDPDRLAYLNISPSEVLAALREQNKQVAAGKINQPPMDTGSAFELIINAQGRLKTEEEFGNIIVKFTPDGKVVKLKDVARLELGAYTYADESYLNNSPSIAIAFFQLPGTNALNTAKLIIKELDEIKKEFPAGVDYVVPFDVTKFVGESVDAVYHTIFEAIILVVLVIMIFLQNWRAAIIPLFAIPVSLIGTFATMYAMGFSINNLSLFGLVLAIGIVVDDAIVVVENVERNMNDGLGVKEATKKAMTQVQGALIAIALVLSAVFVPTAFIEGISGQFYRQFAITIAASTIFSAIVSLTLTPALCAQFLTELDAKPDFFTRVYNASFGWFFKGFNKIFKWIQETYGKCVAQFARFWLIVLALYAGLLCGAAWFFNNTPKGFIPAQDRGYLFSSIQLPDGASFERTQEVMRKASSLIEQIDGVEYAISIVGLNGATFSRASNSGTIFINLEDFKKRLAKGATSKKILAQANAVLVKEIPEAVSFVLPPPPVDGLGNGGDFKFYVQDKTGMGLDAVQKYTNLMAAKSTQQLDSVAVAFTTYRVSNPQLYADIDRERAQMLNVPISAIFDTMQYNLGSIYVNDFNIIGRVYRVVAQAEGKSRRDVNDIYNLYVPNAQGKNVPLGSVANVRRIIGPVNTMRYNLYTAAEVQGNLTPGYSTGQAIKEIERLAEKELPQGMGIEWTDIAYQEKLTGNTAMLVFAMCVIFVFLILAALYESVTLPLAVILVVPLVLLFAIMGVYFRGMDNNIMTQIGFVVLIGLACKNAILIVEFAHQREMKGEELVSSVRNASKNRLRPILMTSLAFILGVVPLAYATGAGSELRQALGTSVFFGMIGVTVFGCVFTPVFYYVIRRFFAAKKSQPAGAQK
ncbi:MAG: multidrug efflux RND transporter permease subunit [Opitutales bacterium]|nr:multidrug efflux RND transporter permease subunit [Opitutales bacterium]